MGELHSLSMAFTSCSSSSNPCLGWDLQNLGIINADSMSLGFESNFSSGYLEDALVEFSERSKRRRLVLFGDDDDDQGSRRNFNHLAKSYWNSGSWNCGISDQDFSCMSQLTCSNYYDHEYPISTSVSSEEPNFNPEAKTPELETISTLEGLASSSSPSFKGSKSTKYIYNQDSYFSSSGRSFNDDDDDDEVKRKRRVITRVVYPFALVKPGGLEGDMTLNDINERILMPPTRPVRHPVGDFACRPCVSARGPGLSGKAVVALTRIHTGNGRGTITIIRTKSN